MEPRSKLRLHPREESLISQSESATQTHEGKGAQQTIVVVNQSQSQSVGDWGCCGGCLTLFFLFFILSAIAGAFPG